MRIANMIPMNYKITAASGFILHKLAVCASGMVHSVYRKTINLSFAGQLVSLQTADSPLSPISLITALTAEEMSALPIAANDTVTTVSGSLHIGQKCAFDFSDVVWQTLLLTSALPPESLSFLENRILSALSMRDAGSFDLLFTKPEKADGIFFLAIAQKHLYQVSYSMSISDWNAAAASLCRLIGLGTGLTPGGDDFLCGVLAGLILCGRSEHPFAHSLRRKILFHLKDTNDISTAFLMCALEGQFSYAINLLAFLPSQNQIFSAFSEIGHSSGTDTLSGIAYILRLHREFLL